VPAPPWRSDTGPDRHRRPHPAAAASGTDGEACRIPHLLREGFAPLPHLTPGGCGEGDRHRRAARRL